MAALGLDARPNPYLDCIPGITDAAPRRFHHYDIRPGAGVGPARPVTSLRERESPGRRLLWRAG